jgi:glutathione S-transferase
MKLYDLELSGNCYKVRLFLALIDTVYDRRPVDFLDGEHKTDPFLTRNAFGEIPVLVDGDVILRDSQAILVYLARKYDRTDWYPGGAADEAAVLQWLMVAESEIARGPNDARLHDKFGYDLDVAAARGRSGRVLAIFEAHLGDRDWLALDRPTIADIACFPYLALGHEGGVPLDPYPAVRAWIARIKALPGFVPMPAI